MVTVNSSPSPTPIIGSNPRTRTRYRLAAITTFRDSSCQLGQFNTANLSSLLIPRTLSFAANTKSAPQRRPSLERKMSEQKTGRRRRSSSLIYQEPPESIEHISDQSALPNLNANWVNAKGGFTFNRVRSHWWKDLYSFETPRCMSMYCDSVTVAQNLQSVGAFESQDLPNSSSVLVDSCRPLR